MNHWQRATIATIVLSATGLGLAACGGKSSGSSASPAAGNSGGGAVKIAFIEQNAGNPYFDNMAAGLKAACKSLGCSVTVTGPATAGAADQVPIIQQQVLQHVSAIAIQPTDPSSALPSLQQAKARGVKIYAVNSDVVPTVRVAAVTPVDFSKVAAQQLALLGKLMNYQGSFAVVSATTIAPFQNEVIAGIKHLLASEAKYAKMKLQTVVYGNDVPDVSTTVTQGLLTHYPNLKAIYAPTTVALAAAAQTIDSAGKAGKIILTGLGEPNDMRKFIKNGTVKEFQLWAPYDQGFVAGYLIDHVATGKLSANPGGSFPVPGYGTQTIGSTGVIIVSPKLDTFNAANIDKFHF